MHKHPGDEGCTDHRLGQRNLPTGKEEVRKRCSEEGKSVRVASKNAWQHKADHRCPSTSHSLRSEGKSNYDASVPRKGRTQSLFTTRD